MRRAQAGKLTPAAEQAFLSALSVTCNVSLAAAAVGACFNAFNRRRKKDPAFAREWRLALQSGYLELETALLASTLAQSHEHDDWRNNDPPAMPPMTVNQALQLMYLHHKEARLNAVEPHQIRRRPREPEAAYHERLVQMAEARLQRQREDFEVAEAARMERGERAWRPAGEALRQAQGGPSIRRCAATQDERTSIRRSAATQDERSAFGLPDLAQVTGWSNADPGKAPHDPRRALFGGWRIEEMEKKLSEATRSEPAGRTVIWMARGR